MNRVCTKCHQQKADEFFKKARERADGLSSWCKACHSAATCAGVDRCKANRNNKRYKTTIHGKIRAKQDKLARRAANRRRPSWSCLASISTIYDRAKKAGLSVDHAVPLLSPFVCGLHTEANLRPCTQKENAIKGNRWWPDCWHAEKSPRFELTGV